MTFTRAGGQIVATLLPQEVDVIRMVVTEVSSLLVDSPSDDAVLDRLFPDIYPHSPRESAELRHLTEDDLKLGKLDAAGVVLDTLGEQIVLTAEQADAWLRAVNDVRLALGVRLAVDDEFDFATAFEQADQSRSVQISVYGYLSHLQESLIDALR